MVFAVGLPFVRNQTLAVVAAVEPHFDSESDSQERKRNADRNGDDRVQHGDPLHLVGLKPVRITS